MNRGCAAGRLMLVVAWIVPLWVFPARAEQPPCLNCDEALRALKDGNERFVANHPGNKDLGPVKRHELEAGQHPFAVVLTCSDSRVPPEIVFDRGLGDLFVIRVAGNITEPFTLGSIDYAVEHLHVPLIVVLGHEQCGAVTAAMGEHESGGNLGKLLHKIYLGQRDSHDKGEALAHAVENNAVHQAELLPQHSDVVREHVEQKALRVVTGIYSLSTGKVHWIGSK